MEIGAQQKVLLTGHKHRSGMHGLAIVVVVSAFLSGCATQELMVLLRLVPTLTCLGGWVVSLIFLVLQ